MLPLVVSYLSILLLILGIVVIPTLRKRNSKPVLTPQDTVLMDTMFNDEFDFIKNNIRKQRSVDALERIWVSEIDDFYMRYIDFIDPRTVNVKCQELEDEIMVRKCFLL